jgi:hypothetical protein|tara:strand:+ start:54 stop:416 length:363 start_codon:yes stop_codon:yes gene_type:complete
MTTKAFYNSILVHAKNSAVTDEHVSLRDLFKNYRNNSGLSLTRLGFRVMQQMDVEYETFKSSDEIKFTAKFRIMMDRYNQYPYYVTKNQLTLFGSEDRIMYKMYGKDLNAWIEHMEEQLN